MEQATAFHLPCCYCGVRLQKGETRKCCAACKKSYYCSKDCQATHWPLHKKTCKLMKETAAFPTLAQFRKEKKRRDAILFGSEPVADRIHWRDLAPSDPDTTRVHAYREAIDNYNLHAFATSKWISTHRRGAIFLDLDAPIPVAGNVYLFPWLTWDAIQFTRDRRMQEIIRDYNPTYEAPVFLYSVDPTSRSLKLWAHVVCTGSLPACLFMGRRTVWGEENILIEIIKTKFEYIKLEHKYDEIKE